MDLHTENKGIGVPEIRTARLILRQPRAQDAAVVTEAINNYDVSRWLAVVPYPYAQSDAEWFIGECAKGAFTAWNIWAGQQFIGTIGLDDDLGYWLAEDAWGHGYATEAARAIVNHHFVTSEADNLKASYFLGNTGSQNVLTKLGFVPTKAIRQNSKAQGKDVDAQLMCLTRLRWQELCHDSPELPRSARG